MFHDVINCEIINRFCTIFCNVKSFRWALNGVSNCPQICKDPKVCDQESDISNIYLYSVKLLLDDHYSLMSLFLFYLKNLKRNTWDKGDTPIQHNENWKRNWAVARLRGNLSLMCLISMTDNLSYSLDYSENQHHSEPAFTRPPKPGLQCCETPNWKPGSTQ